MKERPILMSAPMVIATLEGRKIMTRRVVKKCGLWESTGGQGMRPMPEVCSYGQAGDRLWVRETFVIEDPHEYWYDDPRREMAQIGPQIKWLDDDRGSRPLIPHYRATEPEPHIVCEAAMSDADDDRTRWTPSIFMPRWASRITLEIVGIRVERLNDISYEDACAEGCALTNNRFEPVGNGETWEQTARRLRWPQRSFCQLWNSINGPGSWDINSWVWVIDYKRVHLK